MANTRMFAIALQSKDINFYTESFKEYLGFIGNINYAT